MVCFDYADLRDYYFPNLNMETNKDNFELKFSAVGNLMSD